MNTNNNNEQIFYNAKTNLERAGFEVETISIANASFTANENHTKYTAEISLPQGKTLEDYCSVLLWSVVEDNTGYISLPTSANIVVDDENKISGNQTIKLYTLNQKNYIEFYMSNEAESKTQLESLIAGYTELMLISTPLRVFNQTNTVITYSLDDFFTQARLGFDFSDKSYLITLNYESDEEIECYSLTPREPTSSGDIIINDGDNYYTESSAINAEHHKDYFKFKILRVEQFGVVGYTQDELDSMTDAEKDNIAKFNAAALNKASDFCAKMAKKFLRIMNLSFKPNRIYLQGSVVYFSSDTNFLGNNAVIKLFKNTNNVNDVIVAFSNKEIVNIDDDYGNVGFYDLIIEGRYEGSIGIKEDQAVKCNGNELKTIPKNVTFVNVTAKDFAFGIHINNNTYYNIPLYWTFINCDFKTGMGFNLTGVRNLKLLNSHIDNCLSSGKGNHCLYISEKCSYITVDHCLLENSTGGAIHEFYDSEATVPTDGFNLNNVYKNIIIYSCLTGLDIGLSSKNTVIENVTMVDITRGIKLHSCENVTIKNVHATGAFCQNTKSFASGNERTYNLYKNKEGKWCVGDYYAVSIIGTARAHIIDCYFSFASPLIFAGGYNTKSKEIGNLFINYGSLFKDGLSESNIIFDNCVFESSSNFFSSNEPLNSVNLGNTENYSFVVDGKHVTLRQKHNINFKKCQLHFGFETIVKSLAYLKGNVNFPSNYVFDSCKVMLFIQNIAAQNKISLTGAYFASAAQGSNVTIKDTVFYNNCKTHKIEKINEEIHEYDSPYFKLLSDDAVGTLSNNSSEDYIKLS